MTIMNNSIFDYLKEMIVCMISIEEIHHKKDFLKFIKFPNELYKENPYYVPAIIKEEYTAITKEGNPVYKNAKAAFYIAKRNGKIVGRVAAIVNFLEIDDQQKPKVRFGWLDMIDDIEVTKALLEKVFEYGRKFKLKYAEGPVGFSQMDKAGMLTKGYEELNTMITWYNAPYYVDHLKKMGFETGATWVEYKIKIPESIRPKVVKVSEIIKKRYGLRLLKFKSTKQIIPHVDKMFELINKTYSSLQTYVPIQQYQIDHYKKKYIPFVNPKYITCVTNSEGKIVAFSIIMPSFSKALQKANGKLFPFGFYHILKAQRKNDTAAFYLIGVDPEYQNKGVVALIFKEMNEVFLANGIMNVETNPELIENKAIQALWKDYDSVQHKERQTFKKYF